MKWEFCQLEIYLCAWHTQQKKRWLLFAKIRYNTENIHFDVSQVVSDTKKIVDMSTLRY